MTQTIRIRAALFVVLLAAILFKTETAYSVDITECGQALLPNEVGELQNDLDCEFATIPKRCLDDFSVVCETRDDCPGVNDCVGPHAVYMGKKAFLNSRHPKVRGRVTLNMNGHSIRMGLPDSSAIICRARRCVVNGPGEIFDATVGIGAKTRVDASDLEIHSCDYGITVGGPGKLKLENVNVHDNNILGIKADGSIRATDVISNNNGTFGIATSRLRARGLETNGNMIGVGEFQQSRPLRASIRDWEATGNSEVGLIGRRVKVLDSTLSGNGGASTGADLRTSIAPVLRNTTCSRAEVCTRPGQNSIECNPTGEVWGVCQ